MTPYEIPFILLAAICVAFWAIGVLVAAIAMRGLLDLNNRQWRAWLNGDRRGVAPDGRDDLGFYQHGKN